VLHRRLPGKADKPDKADKHVEAAVVAALHRRVEDVARVAVLERLRLPQVP